MRKSPSKIQACESSVSLSIKEAKGLAGPGHGDIVDPALLFLLLRVLALKPASAWDEDVLKFHALCCMDRVQKDALANGLLTVLLSQRLKEEFDEMTDWD